MQELSILVNEKANYVGYSLSVTLISRYTAASNEVLVGSQ